jgi:FMN phosphatase YigB (HAD superfamily)
VIQDLDLLSNQWSEHLGQQLSLRLGGSASSWSEANQATFLQAWAKRAEWRSDPLERHEDEASALLNAMCEHMAHPAMAREAAGLLMRDVQVQILRQGTALFPGAAETFRELAATYGVHIASGNLSFRTSALLEGMGVGHLVGVHGSPDLVGSAKNTALFYERIFSLAEVLPGQAVVVDDDAKQVKIAHGLGARTVHLHARCDGCPADVHIATFSDLPAALRASLAQGLITSGCAPTERPYPLCLSARA